MAMASRKLLLLPCLVLLFVAAAAALVEAAQPQSTYIVHLAPDHPALSLTPARGGRNALLGPLLGLPRRLSAPRPRLLYTYARAATGVAARLTDAQAAHVAAQPGVLAVHRDQARQLHTTHTPEFLHLNGDGVNVISLSVGSTYAADFYEDSIAIGAFGAVKKGIVVSASAGNSGPGEYTASNIAPWILTVGASTVDREFPADAVLGDGSVYGGVSLYAGEPLNSTKPLVYAADCGSRLCLIGKLDKDKVAGKIVLCERGVNARVEKGAAVGKAGGIGMILANTEESGEELIADPHLIPSTMVGQKFGDKIRQYVKIDPSPTATIVFHGTVIGKSPSAPRVASFSSRGPNSRAAEILKPDVTAPGVNILAAWTGEASPTDLDIDPRRVPFNIISGTSMSCPHVSGLAALLRQAHPEWSPAAVKSALMTTAYNLDNSGEIIKDLATGDQSTPFVRGAGHVDPNSALDPGLVYDADTSDYIGFLCALGYTPSQIAVFTRDGSVADCSEKPARSGDLNYPAFAAVLSSYKDSVTYHRVVRNVGGDAGAVYEAKVESPAGVDATVTPAKLVFDEEHRSLAYEITLAASGNPVIVDGKYSFGSVTWSDGKHNVTSPIAVTWPESAGAASM
ncbi:unnamed protein product [Triticum turgidum subsp. durum]|uniref:Subtilisin-like protease n=1 Tax=Triticum turgidum subsp. durum TaxID=4567 RepID=A0A9R1B3M8_TRITD|nr:unnamed protein product [Triticum turgidum subsp. durum]